MHSCVVIDIEMCKVKEKAQRRFPLQREIIQIGAVLVNEKGDVVSKFSSYVKPAYGEIDQYIMDLTGISFSDLYNAPTLDEALRDFSNWLPNEDVVAASWGPSDKKQLKKEIQKKGINNVKVNALINNSWRDVQKLYQQKEGIKRSPSLSKAIAQMQIIPDGKMHNGLADAYNTAIILKEINQNLQSGIPERKA